MALNPVVELRRMVDEPSEDTYTDAELSDRLSTSNKFAVARDIWRDKMAAASSLVNMSEGGSSRSMSQAYDHAREMAELYDGFANSAADDGTAGHAVLRKITRA